MAKRYPQALREQIILEFHQGRSIRALANDYEPCEATIRQWVERETGGGRARCLFPQDRGVGARSSAVGVVNGECVAAGHRSWSV